MKVKELTRGKSKAKSPIKPIKAPAKKPTKTTTKTNGSRTKAKPKVDSKAVEKLLAKHKAKLQAEKKAAKKPTPPKQEAKPKKKIERKRLTRSIEMNESMSVHNNKAKLLPVGSTTGRDILKQQINASFAAYMAREAAKKRAAKGIKLKKMTMKVPPQRVLALQVRNREQPEWGILRSFVVTDHTPESQIEKWRAELADLKIGWSITDYFGSDAQYKIDFVTIPGRTVEV